MQILTQTHTGSCIREVIDSCWKKEEQKNPENSNQHRVKQEMCHVPLGSTPDLEMLHT